MRHLGVAHLALVEAAQRFGLDRRGLHVERHIEPHGTSAPVAAQVPRLLQLIGDLGGVPHHCSVFGHRTHARYDIELLIAELPQRQRRRTDRRFALHLSRDDEHRDRIEPAAQHTREGVRAARTARNAYGRNAARQARVAFGGDGRRLFVVVVDAMQPFVMAESVVQVHRTPARYREHMLHAPFGEEIGDVFCQFDLHIRIIFRVSVSSHPCRRRAPRGSCP